ncbi:MAG: VOC family protein [Chloroflexi bacterium]|nr:VOC family protein [Chloroflexota bacterium]
MAESGSQDYRVRLGHVRLKVRNMDRAVAFYTRVFHMRLVEKVENDYAFLSGSESYHEIALQRVSELAPACPPEATGMDHVAFELADKEDLARAYLALSEAGVTPRTVDNGISWAMYFNDPDGNQLEFYCDTRRSPGGREKWVGRIDELPPASILKALREREDPTRLKG